ncbi:transmembrane signal receptor [Lithospermum erythrorhizon]|uniref:Receptor-like serine/threonine-protein kinase n=1 Tax=Lithospermum erythrorhizon TaxID=34254 RepID=A0AAV3NW87_LITER
MDIMRYFSLIIYFSLIFLKGHHMFKGDKIYSNQSFSGDQTMIVSAGGNFKLKLFKLGISSYNSKNNYYLGISYYKLDDVASSVVWVANRERPISDTDSAVLKILDGNLVLLNELEETMWSTNIVFNSTKGSNRLVAVLRDDGNLVLTDEADLETNSPFWQSFDHPGNILLPGAKISFNKSSNTGQMLTSWKYGEDPAPGLFSLELDSNGNQLITTLNRSRSYWISGSWGDRMFGLGERNNTSYNLRYVDNENESYFIYSLDNPSTMSMFRIQEWGQFEQLIWMKVSKGWNLISSQPRLQCESNCGTFSICDNRNTSTCIDGLTYMHYNPFDSRSGDDVCLGRPYCKYSTYPDFQRKKFKNIPNIFVRQSPISTAVSIAECESTCLSNRFCTAYASDDGRCSIWNDGLLNMQQRLPGDIGRTIYVKFAVSEFSTSKTNIATVLGSIAIMLVLLLVLPFIVWKHRKIIIKRAKMVIDLVVAFLYRYLQIANKRVLEKLRGRSFGSMLLWSKLHRSEDFQAGFSEIPIFSFEMIQAATDNFSAGNKLGEGGFGPVFKGTLPNGQDIAVKRLSRTSGQGVEEFKNEVTLISKVQHWNLVKLLGFCIQGDDRMLVYEYMPNKSLDSFIFGPASTENQVLDWGLRNNIIEGIARGLLYLHRDSRLKIIHRDLKASNILLDEHMNPRISDFGMARIVMIEQSVANTNRVVGTYGYMSPEYAMQGIFSVKSDVFSFGVLLLEIVSGKRNTDFYDYENPQTLLGYAWQLWNEEKTLDLLDLNLANSSNTTQVYRSIQVALLCVQEHVNDRPTMPEVVFMLCSDTSLPPPKKPAFCWTARPDGATPWAAARKTFVGSRNEMSNSSVYGR